MIKVGCLVSSSGGRCSTGISCPLDKVRSNVVLAAATKKGIL